MSSVVQRRCEELARRGELVVMAGAGVSAGPPAAIPGWKPLDAAIFRVLRERLEAGLERPGWLAEVEASVTRAREAEVFPPDYQAQILEEMCGERYFQALQALDIEHGNASHEAIAALAAGGALRAVVTTNFDRLIERALERLGVPFAPAFDEAGYAAVRSGDGPLPVIKVHGSVSSAGSMVDTWKQRRRGRSQALMECLAPLHDAFWIFAGFSAADLDDDDSYLGLLAGAERGPGAVFIRFPGNPELGVGAQKLTAAYGDRGIAPVVDVAEYLGALGATVGSAPPRAVEADEPLGATEVVAGLRRWAGSLGAAAAGLCVAASMEAVGQGESAVRILDRLVRKDELRDERDTPDFRELQLQYGRLGGALGRFVAVPDMQGAASNASVETAQSLLRIANGDVGFVARAWLAPLLLWLGDGEQAAALAAAIIAGCEHGTWDGPQPRTDEEVVDAWICAAQVVVVAADDSTAAGLLGTVDTALARARATGDVVREARVAALHMLARTDVGDDMPALAVTYDSVFSHAHRVDDSVAFGWRALAVAQWFVGPGARPDPRAGAEQALGQFEDAHSHFASLGMDPWLLYLEIQRLKALAALGMYDEVNQRAHLIESALGRFPILSAVFDRAVAQIQHADA